MYPKLVSTANVCLYKISELTLPCPEACGVINTPIEQGMRISISDVQKCAWRNRRAMTICNMNYLHSSKFIKKKTSQLPRHKYLLWKLYLSKKSISDFNIWWKLLMTPIKHYKIIHLRKLPMWGCVFFFIRSTDIFVRNVLPVVATWPAMPCVFGSLISPWT